jgi:uncharacterized protein (DUF1778 family)
MRYKTDNLVVRVTPEQRAVLAGAADKRHESLSAFVRDAALSAAWRWIVADASYERPSTARSPETA